MYPIPPQTGRKSTAGQSILLFVQRFAFLEMKFRSRSKNNSEAKGRRKNRTEPKLSNFGTESSLDTTVNGTAVCTVFQLSRYDIRGRGQGGGKCVPTTRSINMTSLMSYCISYPALCSISYDGYSE